MHEADFIQKKIRAQRCSPKKNSCTGNRPKKKFLQAKNSPPPPPITFLMVRPLCECLLVHKSDITAFYSRSKIQMFSLISGRHVGAQLHGHQHGVSIQSSVNLCGTFGRITRVQNTVQTRDLDKQNILYFSTTYNILDFFHSIVLDLLFLWRDSENQQLASSASPLPLTLLTVLDAVVQRLRSKQ